ncbi:MAG: D-glycero-D-manno-heptose 1,7-bisphosphate phosphatase [Pyrinomonadaceae bacterium]|jgi:D-glycero-D-manno-heptose 1,7-bisphosphate phosphatase|nr:D-glycero-D-manno-heptose 1,7-bisphosphate phosphatase [Pyrinomonadaceae bacterium]
MNRAVFIDRDGTISEEVGYINHLSRFRLFTYSAAAVNQLHQNGYLAIVITNQAGVARGYFSEQMVQAIHQKMTADLETSGARLDAIYYCAHHPSVGEPPYRLDCDCRKPKPGLLLRAARDYDIDLTKSWMVGDRYSDVELAANAGVKSALVLSGYGRGEWEHQRENWTTLPDLVAEDLLAAVKQIGNLDLINSRETT